MRKAATVLVLGDPGPVRDELLLRREIDVIWSASFEDALQLVRVYRIEACILAPAFESVDGYEQFRAAIGDVPFLVTRPTQPASTTLTAPDVEPVLRFLAQQTGLVFARYPRAPLELPVTLEARGQAWERQTLNLSVSGVAIRDFPEVEAGARVEMCIELPQRPVFLLGRVVRLLERSGTRVAGLTFTDLSEPLRMELSRAVEECICGEDGPPRLFGELEIPMPRTLLATGYTVDTDPTPVLPRVVEPDMTPPLPRQLADHASVSIDLIPDWIAQLSDEMSASERLAATGGDAPDWAHRVLSLRLRLARARARKTGDVPPALVDETYRLFSGLEKETWDAPAKEREEVSTIRAALLRDVLGVAT